MCVLIVKDAPIILMVTAFCREGAGFEVKAAHDGSQAVELVEQHPGRFAALVTDFHMPLGITGAHVVMHMRQQYPAIPIIIATALTHAVADEWRREHGVDMLAKPYDPETLVSMLRFALNA